VYFTGCNNSVFNLAVDLITVNVQDLGKGVVATELLQLRESSRDEVRIQQTDIRSGCRFISHRVLLGRDLSVRVCNFDFVQTEGQASLLEVALNVVALRGTLVRDYVVLLNQECVDAAGNEHGRNQLGSNAQAQSPAVVD